MRLPQAIRVAFERSEKRLDEQVGRLERVRVEPAPARSSGRSRRRHSRGPKLGWLFGLLVVVAGVGAALWLHPWADMQRGRGRFGDAPQAVRDRQCDDGRHAGDRQRVGHGDAAGDRDRADADQRAAAGSRLHRGPDGQARAISWRRSTRGPIRSALEQAQGTLAQDQALLAQAQADLKRYQTLSRQDSISAPAGRRPGASWCSRIRARSLADQAKVDSAEAESGLLPHHLAGRRAGRAAAGGSPAITSRHPTPTAWW